MDRRLKAIRQRVLALIGVLAILSCGGRSAFDSPNTVPGCVPGLQVSCGCFDGSRGAQVCRDDGTYGACNCSAGSGGAALGSGGSAHPPGAGGGNVTHGTGGSPNTGGAPRATGAGSGVTAGTGGAATGGVAGSGGGRVTLSTGSQQLVDLFVQADGILIVFTDEIRLVSREGTTLTSVISPRQVTAAAFDGNRLVVADKAKFTSYDLTLTPLVSANLATSCSSAVLIDNARFVCGQDVDWDRLYYTYDANTGVLVASSQQYTYSGLAMKRVPGLNEFVAVEVDSSPANLFLYDVTNSGQPTLLGGSSFETSDPNAVYAFVGNPATQLVVEDGTILNVSGNPCGGGAYGEGCFPQAGELGTLTGAQRFIGMDNDLMGRLYTLVDLAPSYNAACSSGCEVQQIDVASRTVLSQKLYNLSAVYNIVAARQDAVSAALVVGYSASVTGHSVVMLPY